MKLIKQFRIPKDAYERFDEKTKYGYRTKYLFHYTGAVLSSVLALQTAYTDYMRSNTGFDFYDQKTDTFLKQCKLFESEVNYG